MVALDIDATLRRALSAAADELDPAPSPFWDDPLGWVQSEIIWRPGEGPDGYQGNILSSLIEFGRVCVYGPHGLGKTTIAAWALLWYADTRRGLDWKVITTASKWRQLEKYLWPEIHKWNRRLKRPFTKHELLKLNLQLQTGAAGAVASDDPTAIEGAHADHLLYIIDEGKAVPTGTWDAIEGAFSTDTELYALAISTPGAAVGRLWEIASRKAGTEDWHPIHVTLEEAVEAGRVTQEWADQRAKLWGRKSTVYRNRVLGEFAAAETDGVVPELSWIEDANDRWKDIFGETNPGDFDHFDYESMVASGKLEQFTCVGADVARTGGDKTCLALRFGFVIPEIRTTEQESTAETTGRIEGIIRRFGGSAVVDVIGVGAGVVDFLRERGYLVQAFNASERSLLVDSSGELGFTNRRASAWWAMRELLNPDNRYNIALPPDDMLTGDLLAPKYKVVAGGRVQVESKDDIKKRLERSTDYGDAVIQAFAFDPDEILYEDKQMVYEDRVTISPY